MVRTSLIALAVAAGACASKDGGAGGSGQTYAEALRVLCGGGEALPDWSALPPAARDAEASRWLDQRITSSEARALLAALADADDRAGRVRAAATAAGLASCTPLALFHTSSVVAGARVPELAGAERATDDLDQDQVVVAVTPAAVVVDGKAVAPVDGGAVAPGAAMKLMTFLRASADAHGLALDTVTVAADRTLTVAALLPVFDAVWIAGARRVDLVAAAGPRGEARVIPIALPMARAGAPSGDVAAILDGSTVTLVVTGTRRDFLPVPLHPPDEMRDALRRQLSALVPARWPDGGPPPASVRRLRVILGDGAGGVAMPDLLAALAAVRATADGVALRPDLAFELAPEPPAPAPAAAAPPAAPSPAAPPPGAIQDKVATAYMPALRRCYEQALKRDGPGTSGAFALRFTVGKDGRVTHATVEHHARAGDSPRLRACLVSRMQAWRFPAADGEAEYTLPLTLKPA